MQSQTVEVKKESRVGVSDRPVGESIYQLDMTGKGQFQDNICAISLLYQTVDHVSIGSSRARIDDQRCFRLASFQSYQSGTHRVPLLLVPRDVDRRQEQSVEARLMIKVDESINKKLYFFCCYRPCFASRKSEKL